MLYNSVLQMIGNTPILRISNIDTFGNNIYLKLEGYNPSGSTKDRIALSIIDNAEKKGLINKDTTIIEATSGNTGIALAMICAIKKYKLLIIMPDSMSKERIQLLKAYGAQIILTKGELGMKGCMDKLNELKKEIGNVFIANQFENMDNPKAHYENTANEIIDDLNGKIDVFICGTGTGGSFSGIAKKLKEKIANIKTYPVEPSNSPLLSKGYTGSHKIQGMGMSLGKVPDVFDSTLADDILTVSCEDAFEMTKKIALEEGLLLGISSGANLFSALEFSKKNANKNLNIVVLSTDLGNKYMSSNVFLQ